MQTHFCSTPHRCWVGHHEPTVHHKHEDGAATFPCNIIFCSSWCPRSRCWGQRGELFVPCSWLQGVCELFVPFRGCDEGWWVCGFANPASSSDADVCPPWMNISSSWAMHRVVGGTRAPCSVQSCSCKSFMAISLVDSSGTPKQQEDGENPWWTRARWSESYLWKWYARKTKYE